MIVGSVASANTRIRCDGDSLTAASYPTTLFGLLGSSYEVANNGEGGATAATMATEAQAQNGDYCRSYFRTYYVLWAGTNDIAGGATAAATHANLRSCWATMKANGARVVAVNIIKRAMFDAGMETKRQAVNALIAADVGTLCDALVDVSARAEFSDTGDATYFTDGTHLTSAGYAIVAALVKSAIDSLGG